MACLPTGGYANENGPRKQGMAVSVHGCRCLIRCLLALYLICVVTFAAQADRVSERRAIGLELVLAVDNSLSVNGREFALQIAQVLEQCVRGTPTHGCLVVIPEPCFRPENQGALITDTGTTIGLRF
jgi:hypothetical protein